MNRKVLAKMYDQLAPWERGPLMIAAEARGDQAEFDRLNRSAPRRVSQVFDHADLIHALHWLAAMQVMRQLDLAAQFSQVGEMCNQHFWSQHGGDDSRVDRLGTLARLLTYRFLTNADAWRRFCGDLGIDPNALLVGYPGKDSLKWTKEIARVVACMQEEAAVDARRRDPEAEAPVVGGTVKVMQEALDRLAES